jgi:hypothetical protein
MGLGITAFSADFGALLLSTTHFMFAAGGCMAGGAIVGIKSRSAQGALVGCVAGYIKGMAEGMYLQAYETVLGVISITAGVASDVVGGNTGWDRKNQRIVVAPSTLRTLVIGGLSIIDPEPATDTVLNIAALANDVLSWPKPPWQPP